jgi:multidrug resistance efflux pump
VAKIKKKVKKQKEAPKEKLLTGKDTIEAGSIESRVKQIDNDMAINRQQLQKAQNNVRALEGMLNAQAGARAELSLLLKPKDDENDGAKDKT